jgi:hypothetical protein
MLSGTFIAAIIFLANTIIIARFCRLYDLTEKRWRSADSAGTILGYAGASIMAGLFALAMGIELAMSLKA